MKIIDIRAKNSRAIKQSPGDRIFGICNVLFLSIATFITIIPLLIVLLSSVTPYADIINNPTAFIVIPSKITFSNFEWLFRGSRKLIDGYSLTIIRTLVGTLVCLVVTVLTAYPLSKSFLPGRKYIMMMFIFTMLFSGGLIPTYLVVRGVNLINTFWAMIIPCALNVYNMIIMRTFFSSIPEELSESAHIDGASEMMTLFRIILPVAMPSIACITLFYAVFHWNTFMDVVIYITDRKLWPLQMLLREILVASSVNELSLGGSIVDGERPGFSVIANCIIVVSAIPIICVYPFLQRYFVKGLMIGSIKG